VRVLRFKNPVGVGIVIMLLVGVGVSGCSPEAGQESTTDLDPIWFRGPYHGEVGEAEAGYRWAVYHFGVVVDERSGRTLIPDYFLGNTDFPFKTPLSLVEPDGTRLALPFVAGGLPVGFSAGGDSHALMTFALTLSPKWGQFGIYNMPLLTLSWHDADGGLIYETQRRYPETAEDILRILLPGVCRLVDGGQRLLVAWPPDGWEPQAGEQWETLLVDRSGAALVLHRSTSPPVVSDDGTLLFYVGTGDDGKGSLMALGTDGRTRWEAGFESEVTGGPFVSSSADLVVVLTGSGAMALDHTGSVTWTSQGAYRTAVVADSGDTALVGKGFVEYRGPDGTLRWRRVAARESSVAVSPDGHYVLLAENDPLTDSARFTLLDRSGKDLAAYRAESPPENPCVPLVWFWEDRPCFCHGWEAGFFQGADGGWTPMTTLLLVDFRVPDRYGMSARALADGRYLLVRVDDRNLVLYDVEDIVP